MDGAKVAKFFTEHIPDLHTLQCPRPHNLYDYYLFSLFSAVVVVVGTSVSGWGNPIIEPAVEEFYKSFQLQLTRCLRMPRNCRSAQGVLP